MYNDLDSLLADYPLNVPVYIAAKMMGKPPAFVQFGLEMGTLPFGSCVRREKASFHIPPRAFWHYLTGE